MKTGGTCFYRSKLPVTEQLIYDCLLEQWASLVPVLCAKGSTVSILKSVEAIALDHPELFYVSFNQFRYIYDSGTLKITDSYLFPKEEIPGLSATVTAWGKHIVTSMPPNMAITERSLWLHNVLARNVSYGESPNLCSHQLLGVAKHRLAVCEGIAKGYKHLCDLSSIPCILVNGSMLSDDHSWNLIWIEDLPGFVDVTSDMSISTGDRIEQIFFCAVRMKWSHILGAANLFPTLSLRIKQIA